MDKLLVGRCEWCCLPALNIPAIKVKIDTGARTSAIHAFDIVPIVTDKVRYVTFKVYPIQTNKSIVRICQAPVIDERYIMSSNGHKERRYIIKTPLKLGGNTHLIELSLSNRDPLSFRMLLGREALSKRMMVDPGVSCKQGRYRRVDIERLYID
jgi:ribosomal protein S6--L-glutamate ligase